MASSIRVSKTCEYCKQEFVAKTIHTRYCSHRCNQRGYKRKERNAKVNLDLTTIDTNIHLDCETAIFRYIVDRLMPAFRDLKFIAIEKSALFYFKKGNLIKAQNLYSSKIDNPKLKEDIDKIFKHLQ